MIIIVDKRVPQHARDELSRYGELLELESTGIVYDSISGHPDIFFCYYDQKLFYAPNLAQEFKDRLADLPVQCIAGEKDLGGTYPETARYNAVITFTHIIGNIRYIDSSISKYLHYQKPIQVNQGYCRCNLLALNDTHFITSDAGIAKTLKQHNFEVLYVDPKEIILPGKAHGFFGGACGICQDDLFIIGSLKYIRDGDTIRQFLTRSGYRIIELYEGPLFDGGGIFCFP